MRDYRSSSKGGGRKGRNLCSDVEKADVLINHGRCKKGNRPQESRGEGEGPFTGLTKRWRGRGEGKKRLEFGAFVTCSLERNTEGGKRGRK